MRGHRKEKKDRLSKCDLCDWKGTKKGLTIHKSIKHAKLIKEEWMKKYKYILPIIWGIAWGLGYEVFVVVSITAYWLFTPTNKEEKWRNNLS